MRPFTGSREVLRRLEERNTARRERVNQVRQLGGLDPTPEPLQQYPGSMHEWDYVSYASQNYEHGQNFQDAVQLAAYNMISGRSGRGAYNWGRAMTSYWHQQEPIILDTERSLSNRTLEHLRDGIEIQRKSLFSGDEVLDVDLMFKVAFGQVTEEEYQYIKAKKELKKKKVIHNSDCKFLLSEKEV